MPRVPENRLSLKSFRLCLLVKGGKEKESKNGTRRKERQGKEHILIIPHIITHGLDRATLRHHRGENPLEIVTDVPVICLGNQHGGALARPSFLLLQPKQCFEMRRQLQ